LKENIMGSKKYIDYPLQGTSLDIPMEELMEYDDEERGVYIDMMLDGFSKEISKGTMSLKKRVSFKDEIADYRKLARLPADAYLMTDDKYHKRNVLGIGSPGAKHTYHLRHHMWKMVTKQGSLESQIKTKNVNLVKKIDKLLDPKNQSKAQFRGSGGTAIQVVSRFLQMNNSVGAAFPPFHARFLANEFLPKEGDCLVIDPCAGWGGRLLGTICVKRKAFVKYVGIDPEKRNLEAYQALQGYCWKYLKREVGGERDSEIYSKPFEVWIKSRAAKQYMGKADLVMTSPPYYDAELYNDSNTKQSAKKFQTYEQWRDGFYTELIQGAYDLLKEGGVFILNVANVKSAEKLESDARKIAKLVGFQDIGYYKLAMGVTPGTRQNIRHSVIVDGALYKYEPVFCFRR
jgi:tRNA1(Val) A37 N6-methylase TrmN6